MWEDGIQMDINGSGCIGLDWDKLAQNMNHWRDFVNNVINVRVS